MNDILYVATQSAGRRELLEDAAIPFRLLAHSSSEQETQYTGDIVAYVCGIAQHKMATLTLPPRQEVGSDRLFVLTADTVIQHPVTHEIFGKPVDRADAVRMLALHRDNEVLVISGCCLKKYLWRDGAWYLDQTATWATGARAVFSVPSHAIDRYLAMCPGAMRSCGAGICERFGLNFFKSMSGSYTTIKGLPIFELREQLEKMGFK